MAAPRDIHEPVLPPVPLSPPVSAQRTLANVQGPAERRMWLNTITAMAAEPDANTFELNLIRLWITEGVSLDFESDPSSIEYDNTSTVAQHADTVRTRLLEYIQFEAVVPLPSDHPLPYGVQPLHVIIKPNKKARLVIDLSRNLNPHLRYEYFSYSSVNDAAEASFQDCWYGKLDLSNCFLSFPLHPSCFPHFIFRFEGRLYQFRCMPFGLSSAPRICTMLLSVVAYHLNSAQLAALIRYLDDFLFIADSRSSSQLALDSAHRALSAFGLVVNPDKTEGPTQIITFLGVQLDAIRQTLSCTPARVDELLLLLRAAITSRKVSLSSLSSLIGKLSFAAMVLPGARPFMRRMIDLKHKRTHDSTQHLHPPLPALASAGTLRASAAPSPARTEHRADPRARASPSRPQSTLPASSTHREESRLHFRRRNASVYLDPGFGADANFWIDPLHRWNGTARWRHSRASPVCFASDASLDGFGFYLESTPPPLDTQQWPTHLRVGTGFSGLYSPCHDDFHTQSGHMQWCELLAVLSALYMYGPLLENQSVLFYVDNKTDVHIINRQATRSERLAGLLRALYALALKHKICIHAQHRRGVDNTLADFLSRPALHRHDFVHRWQLAHPSLSSLLRSVSVVYSQQIINV